MPEIFHAGIHATLAKRGRYYRADWTAQGTRHRRSTGSGDLSEAREIACELIERSTRTEAQDSDLTRLSVAAERMWQEKWKHQSAGPQRMKHIAEVIDLIGDVPIEKINHAQLVTLRTALDKTDISQPTINRKLLSVRAILGQAAGPWEILSGAPKAPLYSEGEGCPRALSDAEVKKLLEVAPSDHWRWFFQFMIETGLRRGEVLRLKWSDFCLEENFASVTVIGERINREPGNGRGRRGKRDTSKSKGTRTVPLEEPMRRYLLSRSEEAAASEGPPIKPFDVSIQRIKTTWALCRAELGLTEDWEFVFHTLRHTCATNLAKRRVPAMAIKDWMGHSSFKTTERYINLVAGDLRKYSAGVSV